MNTQTPSIPSATFKDRKAGLMIFGILTLLMGVVCALFVPLVIVGQMMMAKNPGSHAQPPQQVALIAGVYGPMAVALIWLGIGSMMARRWARAVLLIFSWSWLITGVLALAFFAMMVPQLVQSLQSAQPPGQAEMSAAAKSIILLIPGVILAGLFLIMPLIWILFYQSRHVKATCEARDPVERWTDRCPLPVLAITLWLAFGAVMMLFMPICYRGVFPFFGTFLVGWAGTVSYVALAVIWGYAAYAIYKLDRRGWWLIFVTLCLFSISCVLTYARHDLMELYGLMGYSEEQMAQIAKLKFFKNGMMVWSSLIYSVPFLGYLLCVRRFFSRTKAPVPS